MSLSPSHQEQRKTGRGRAGQRPVIPLASWREKRDTASLPGDRLNSEEPENK